SCCGRCAAPAAGATCRPTPWSAPARATARSSSAPPASGDSRSSRSNALEHRRAQQRISRLPGGFDLRRKDVDQRVLEREEQRILDAAEILGLDAVGGVPLAELAQRQGNALRSRNIPG